ncbi:MAG: TonB-dependent receptor plug domain-containing protein [Porticoccaceae bacterium]
MMKRTKIAAAVSAVCTVMAAQSHAQETQLEEVVVTGIRGSMQMAMDVKRNSSGVVDAISAEDMGKFPDTNLAESLQRITGVSIDRSQGEGSQVTVRGFAGQFNLVTLNGRQMPSANVPNTSGNSFGAVRVTPVRSTSRPWPLKAYPVCKSIKPVVPLRQLAVLVPPLTSTPSVLWKLVTRPLSAPSW